MSACPNTLAKDLAAGAIGTLRTSHVARRNSQHAQSAGCSPLPHKLHSPPHVAQSLIGRRKLGITKAKATSKVFYIFTYPPSGDGALYFLLFCHPLAAATPMDSNSRIYFDQNSSDVRLNFPRWWLPDLNNHSHSLGWFIPHWSTIRSKLKGWYWNITDHVSRRGYIISRGSRDTRPFPGNTNSGSSVASAITMFASSCPNHFRPRSATTAANVLGHEPEEGEEDAGAASKEVLALHQRPSTGDCSPFISATFFLILMQCNWPMGSQSCERCKKFGYTCLIDGLEDPKRRKLASLKCWQCRESKQKVRKPETISKGLPLT